MNFHLFKQTARYCDVFEAFYDNISSKSNFLWLGSMKVLLRLILHMKLLVTWSKTFNNSFFGLSISHEWSPQSTYLWSSPWTFEFAGQLLGTCSFIFKAHRPGDCKQSDLFGLQVKLSLVTTLGKTIPLSVLPKDTTSELADLFPH